MPTLEHSGLVEMFRRNPALAPHFLATLFRVDVPRHTSVKVADATLDQLIPVEFRADLVLELVEPHGKKSRFVLAIVLEVQREIDARKKYSWPVYVAVARAERECPTMVLVVAPDGDVATWATENIDLGLGLGVVQPLVLGPATVPEVTDPAEAENELELTILSAMTHGNGPKGLAIVEAALNALGRLDREHAAVYFQLIWDALREPMQRALEALVMQRQTEGEVKYPAFAQRIFEQGELKGETRGRLEGKRDALLRLLAHARIALTEDELARIRACTDAALLDRWVENVLGAKTAADVLSQA